MANFREFYKINCTRVVPVPVPPVPKKKLPIPARPGGHPGVSGKLDMPAMTYRARSTHDMTYRSWSCLSAWNRALEGYMEKAKHG